MLNRITTVEPSSVSQPCSNAMLAVRACGVCGFPNIKPALKVNDVDVGHCCLSFIGNLSKCNGNKSVQELESQTNYINNLKK